MKRFVKYSIFILITVVLLNINTEVKASDSIYSFNKYSEEVYNFIQDSYNSTLKKDGQLVGGSILKNKEIDENNYQTIIVKYDSNGKIIWKYLYGDTKENYLKSISYTYNENKDIDGYLLVIEENEVIDNNSNHKTVFIKVDFDGKFVWKKESGINEAIIEKIIPIINKDNNCDGYVAYANNESNGFLIKYDKDFNLEWNKNYDNSIYQDLSLIKNNNEIIGYVAIISNSNIKQLVKYNLSGDLEKVIKDSLDNNNSYSLTEANNGFVLYGSTSEVKLKNGNNSYFLINYNNNDEEYWETIGDTSIKNSKKIILKPLYKNKQINEYLLLYRHKNNTEIVRIDSEGMIKEKIKKVYSEYYDIEDFNFKGNVLYLVGQINCPKDDTCDYDANSLYLVSDEDKVIEVKDNTGRNIIIGFTIFILLIIGIVFLKKKS